jgi:hypothetical protein
MINSLVVVEACEKLARKNYYYICDILAGLKLNKIWVVNSTTE